MNVKQNVVLSNSPRKAIVPSGIVFRFGFEPLAGSQFSKVGEVLCHALPLVEELRAAQHEYCRLHNIDEPFVPSDYGY